MTNNGLTQAELFDVFSNARRRRTVRFLRKKGGSCDLAPLVEQVAAWENNTNTDSVTRAQRRRVYISLYQTHLPMLEDHGIVDWDADAHSIELLPSEKLFEPYLDRHTGTERRWHRLYAGVAALGVLALTFSVLSLGPLSIGAAPLIALTVSGAIFLLSVAHRASKTGNPLGPLARF